MAQGFYPEIEPFNKFRLKVSPLHELYVEEAGNPHGQPALFLHGGPGGGLQDFQRRFFDPSHYRIILFDQRGCGQSTPFASLEENTTWDLVSDIEKIRKQLKIDRWLVFGGSWGSTLALAYAQTHPQSVSALVLRGIFLCRKEELDWFYQKGCDLLFPEFWEDYIRPIAQKDRHNMIDAYYIKLTSSDERERSEAAIAWSKWEGRTVKLIPDNDTIEHFSGDKVAQALARIECHYFINKSFFKSDNHLIENVQKIRHIPTTIVHGRYDVVCPVKNAWELHQSFPESHLEIVPDAGHAASEVGVLQALIRATEFYKGVK